MITKNILMVLFCLGTLSTIHSMQQKIIIGKVTIPSRLVIRLSIIKVPFQSIDIIEFKTNG